jgi:Arylsulfotransferase (ASST)
VRMKIPAGWVGKVGRGPLRSGNVVARRPLTPGHALLVRFNRAGKPSARSLFHLRCLPPDFPPYSFVRTGPGGPDFFMIQMNHHYATIFDRHGVPIWWYKAPGQTLDAQLLPDGTFSWGNGVQVRKLNGQPVRVVTPAGGLRIDPHDFRLLPNGNYLLGARVTKQHVDASPYGGPSDATVRGYQIQEVTPNGELVWKWNSLSHIGLAETTTRWWKAILARGEPYDIQHWNSVEADGKYLLLSFRMLDAVYEINRNTGAVVWKLGGTTIAKSLQVLDDPFASYPLGGQHDARRLPDGTISIYDNATNLFMPTRAVRYLVDPVARTAKLVESVSDPDYPASPCCGSARKLPSGGWLIGWGRADFVGAYDSAGQRIFKLDFPNGTFYRAFPVPPDAITAPQLREAMNAMAD